MEEQTFALREVHALDEGGGFTGPLDVVVIDGVIEAVEVDAPTPSDAADIDCSGTWLMPGVFDCHAHLDCFTDDVLEVMDLDVVRWTLRAAATARGLLEIGITSVRDPGGATPGIRDGIAAGWVPGPELFVSGPPLSQTGGHTDGFVPSTGTEAITGFMVPDYPGRPPYLVDGADEMRKAVRLHLRSGVDWIKICTTGGLLSTGRDHPLKAEFTDEEISAAVIEAGRAGVPVAAHAYGGPGLEAAIRLGVRSVEHGIYLTEAQAARMAEQECWLVPTLVVCHELADLAAAGALDGRSKDRVAEVMSAVGQQVAMARAAGVRIATGSDLVSQGRNLEEIALLGDAGLTSAEALLAATANGADLCGSSDRGRLEPGKVFDAILLDQDPSDLEVFRNPDAVSGVFKGGHPVKAHERLAGVLV